MGPEKFYAQYHDKDLKELDFPYNRFGAQAPGMNAEIHEFCTLKNNTRFERFRKIGVNGAGQSKLFRWLKAQKAFGGFDGLKAKTLIPIVSKTDTDRKTSSDIKWKFTKFLVDRGSRVVERFESTITP